MAKYRISKRALKDLDEIWLYTRKNWSASQADRYYNLLIKEIEYVSRNHASGKSYDYVKSGYWGAIMKSHIVFYRLGEDGLVEVIRVLHQRMDIENRLMD